MTTPDIHWPARYHPEASPIHAVNAIDIDAPSARVWELLVNPYRWPEYYPHAVARDVSGGQTLTAGATFVMHTADVDLHNTVREFDPQHRISWEALYVDGSAAYHAWVITSTDQGCHVHTEETQQGPFWEELARKMPGALHQYHQTWVENLAAAAVSGVAQPTRDSLADPGYEDGKRPGEPFVPTIEPFFAEKGASLHSNS